MRERRTGFMVGFATSLLLMALVQAFAAHRRSDCGIRAVLALWNLAISSCADDIVRVGFPFVVIARGGFIGLNSFSLPALLVDVLLVLVVSGIGGIIGANWLTRRHDRARGATRDVR